MSDIAAEIRRLQMAAIEDVERQLQTDAPRIEVRGETISREAAWAATRAITAAWDRDLRYDGQTRAPDGEWFARAQEPESGAIVEIPLGVFPSDLARGPAEGDARAEP